MRRLNSLTPITGDESRCKLVFDDGTVIKTSVTVAVDHGLRTGMTLDDDAWQALTDAVEAASAKLRAVRIVSATAVSDKELRRRLVRKGESVENANAAADWLKELGVVDDAELARRVALRAAGKGYGAARIRQELYAKGIPKQYWEEAMADLPDPDDAIDRFIAQRLRGAHPDRKEQQRLIDALRRRGHSWEDIKSALNRYEIALEDAFYE